MNEVQQPQAVDIGGIIKHFFEHSPISDKRGYQMLSRVSDKELDLFCGLIKTSDIADQPTDKVYLTEVSSKDSGRKLLVKAARYDDQVHTMIAMAVFDKDKPTQEEAIESFALFADEYGKGFIPVHFETHTKQ